MYHWAVAAAQRDFADHWTPEERGSVAGVLHDIARDERIMGAAACPAGAAQLAATEDYPGGVDCAAFATELRTPGPMVRSTAVSVTVSPPETARD